MGGLSEQLHYSQSTVNRILKEYDHETFSLHKQRPGSARKTTPDDDRHLIVLAKH